MKISMKNSEEKGGSSSSSLNGNGNKIRIAVFGQHDVGKSGKNRKFLYKFKISLAHTTFKKIFGHRQKLTDLTLTLMLTSFKSSSASASTLKLDVEEKVIYNVFIF